MCTVMYVLHMMWRELAEGVLAPGNQGPAAFGFQGRQTAGDVWSLWFVKHLPASVAVGGRGALACGQMGKSHFQKKEQFFTS